MKKYVVLIGCLIALVAPLCFAQTMLKIESQGVQLDGYFYTASSSKAPTLVALHGCGGMLNRQGKPNLRTMAYSKLLNEQGWHVLFLDSFTPRGVKSVCGGTNQIAQSTRVADVQAVVAFLATRPEIDAKRIGVMGWSHGATTTLLADGVDVAYATPVVAFAHFYPGCGSPEAQRRWTPAKPLLMQVGALDDWTDPVPCQRLASRFPKMIELKTYANAYHDFDTDEPVRERKDITSRLTGKPAHAGGEPVAKAASQARLIAFFKEHFR